ncbi:Acyl-CoA dehydrogenase [Pseudomonas reinekei]|uniref:Acyl-CoA dehydrogenase n=1 Tax=Pseudomonas reinekei TaxID=395598 RepID=A0A1H0IVD4_PSERE|nr:indole-3-acetate monooxygenase [Pseudomonas reinekei]KAB0486638.1 flavin-dependent monooxygenase [Pseudomonas reinekei]OLU04362.1 acyl-CoA dehydrogenase [Pseudomonas reinekei]SDO35001.1 Acyl-CoA dehydrogenase [Pseudomonas reinekei]
MSSQTVTKAVYATAADQAANFDALLNNIRERAREGEFDRQRYISQDVIDGFKAHGVYRALVPKRFGGNEWSPVQFCELIEKISHADGSAGWVASFGMSPVYLAALPPETIAKVYENGPDVVFAGGIFPPQPADVVAGGYKVNGRWKYSSGSMGAEILGVGIAPRNGDKMDLPRIAVMPRSAARIDHTWDTVGLAGTGSHDLVVEDYVVPEEWTFVRGGPANLDELFFRYPSLSFAAQVLSVVGLGVARAALDELRGMASGRISVTGAPALADRPLAQVEIAKAEAALLSARAFFYESMESAWQHVIAGDVVPDDAISLLRLSSTHAVRTAADVARIAQLLSGMSGVYTDSPLARCVNDANVVTQHAFMGDITYQNAGAIFFGKSPSPGYL